MDYQEPVSFQLNGIEKMIKKKMLFFWSRKFTVEIYVRVEFMTCVSAGDCESTIQFVL